MFTGENVISELLEFAWSRTSYYKYPQHYAKSVYQLKSGSLHGSTNSRNSGSTAPQQKHHAENASNDHVSLTFHRSRLFPPNLSCHHVDQVDEKASSGSSRPRPPCTSKAKHQGNDENQVLEDRGEVAFEAAALVLSWLAQGA